MIPEHAAALRAEATRANERRLLVLAGDRDLAVDAAHDALDAADVDAGDAAIVTDREGYRFEEVAPRSAGSLLGRTLDAVIVDAHDYFAPNTIGQVVGAVDGGGLLVLLCPPLDEWPDRRDEFDETLAVPPATVDDVTGRFRRRFVETLRQHEGVSIVDVAADADADAGTGAGASELAADGRTDPPERGERAAPSTPADATFPDFAYESCLTGDQARAVHALERLRAEGNAVVVEADRGRGKSSAAGLAAAALAVDGRDVLVTAPNFSNAEELFARAREFLSSRNAIRSVREDGRHIETGAGGVVRYCTPTEAAEISADPDAVVVDEAAAIPVSILDAFLDAHSVAFCTTVHGYEGAGRGFSVRFRDHLADSDLDVHEERLDEPIRYARGDPVERWAFRALMLDARPAVDQIVADATPESVDYRELSAAELAGDDHLLSEAFGLLVLAHYRTEPNDLARVLDAPNLSVRALCQDGHVVSVDLLAREGSLQPETRTAMYEGSRVRGNMIPDVLTSQLRDPDAGEQVGLRTVRIATHHAVRDEGLGEHLLDCIHDEFGGRDADDSTDSVDWFGVGYGATPQLLRFWRRAGYRTVHLSTTRNDASGEYSAVMLRPSSEAGAELHGRHARFFRDRIRDVLSDALRDVDPDVVRGALAACDAEPAIDLTAQDWRVVVGASFGPGMYDAAPGGFRDLALAHLLERDADLSVAAERLLVAKVLQGAHWDDVADELDYVSTGTCMRALGDAYRPLVETYGDHPVVAEDVERFD